MRLSLNVVKRYIDIDDSIENLVDRINRQLGGVEDVINLKDKYKDVVIIKVVSAQKHPDADKLSVCLIDDGGKVYDVPRNDDGLVQVVCGAPNVKAGMFAAWLPPKSTVPSSYDSEKFILDARPLRGVLSQGMLAAADELDMGSDHDGILEISSDESNFADIAIKPGLSFAEVFGLDGYVIDIENKMFTHRPDLFGQLGLIRELAAIYKLDFEDDAQQPISNDYIAGSKLPLEVFNDAQDGSPRFMVAAMADIQIKPSPIWLQAELVAMGSKPINNVVDITNYIMLMTAQPTHAYDYDKIAGHKIGTRFARDGESLTLLNGKTYQLSQNDVVIADDSGAIGLAGIMGGGNSEVSTETKNIIIEVANFDMYKLRKTSMRHGLFTDALTRFNKGQSPLQTEYVMNKIILMMQQIVDAKLASQICDANNSSFKNSVIKTDAEFINSRLGLSLSAEEIIQILKSAKIEANLAGNSIEVQPPFWRTDLEIEEDVVEEVGRLYGFNDLPKQLPSRLAKSPQINHLRNLKDILRLALKQYGANEVLSYTFVNQKIIEKALQNPQNSFTLSNALSPNLQKYRLSILPNLLDKVHMNIKQGFDEFALYEIGKAHSKNDLNVDGLPNEKNLLDFVYASKQVHEGSAYYRVQNTLKNLLVVLKIEFKLEVLSENLARDDQFAMFEPKRSAAIIVNGVPIGVVGEFKKSLNKNFKLPEYTAGFSLNLDEILKNYDSNKTTYQSLVKYPATSQDISIKVPNEVSYAEVIELVESIKSADIDRASWQPVSIYRADGSKAKTITLSGRFINNQATLKDYQVSALLDEIFNQAKIKFGAERG